MLVGILIAYPLPTANRHRSDGQVLANHYVFAGYDPKLLRPLADSLDDVFAKEPIGGTLQDIADNIRGWSKAIIDHGHSHPEMDDVFFTAPFVGSVVSWLDSKARDSSACSTLASLTTPVSSGVRTYRVGVMVKILMLCKSLTTARDLDRVVKLVLKTVLEPQVFRDTLASLENCPHPSTISRFAFYIDMAYARYWRVQRWSRILEDLACGKASVDFSGDSSPQFGRDWFLMEIHVIDNLEELDRVHTELLALLPGDAFMVEAAWSRWFESQSQETIANIVKLTAAITSFVVRHVLIPTGLAARRTSLLNKMHNVLHAFMVDIGQWRRVLLILNLITSVCTDQGVESLIAGCPLTARDLQAEAGFMPKLEDMKEDDPSAHEASGAAGADDPSAHEASGAAGAANVMMPNSLWVPGILHVVHNAIEEILSNMAHAQHWLKLMRTISGFLKHKDLREMFANECLTGAATAFRPLVLVMPEVFIEWRWGSLIAVCVHLAAIRGILQMHWNTNKMESANDRKKRAIKEKADAEKTLHGAAEERRNTEYEVDNNPKAVSEVIEDNMFWSFLDMLLVLAGPIRSFLAWLQRCRCHPSARLGKLCGFVMTQIEKLKVAPCPLCGRHAPEMAQGIWQKVLTDLMELAELDFLRTVSGLSAGERDVVKRDWEAGKAAFIFELCSKLDFWNHLPYKLCALGARCADAARAAALVCINEWNRCSTASKQLQHDVAKRFLDEQGKLRPLLEEFMAGKPL